MASDQKGKKPNFSQSQNTPEQNPPTPTPTPPVPPTTKWKFRGNTEDERDDSQMGFDTLIGLLERLQIIPVVAITQREIDCMREALFATYTEEVVE